MKNKKAVSPLMWAIIVIIPMLIILGIVMFNLFNVQSLWTKSYDEFEMKARVGSCKAFSTGEELDIDGDGYPDGCDVCLGGNDATDTDKDGMPDKCDKDPLMAPEKKETAKDICKGKWDSKRMRCVLPKA